MIQLPRLLDSSLNEVKRLRPISLSISENIVPLSTASMTLLPEEEIPERSWVELFNINGSAGVYMAKKPNRQYADIELNYSLEHAICDVGNWIIKDDIDQTKETLSQAITQVFAYYGGNKWQFGSCSVTDNIVFSASYGENLLSKINSLIAEANNAMMTFDFSTSPWTFNVVSKGTTVTAEGRLSRNISSVSISRDDSELCTRVFCKGLGSGGGIGYTDADTVLTYGVIEGYISGEDYTEEQAQTVAAQYLAGHKRPKYAISINMLDFSERTGETLDRITIGKLFRIVIPEDNITIEENVTGISWNDVYNNPESATVTLSEEEVKIEKYLTQTNNQVSSQISSIERTVSNIEEEASEFSSDIEKLNDKITLVVTETQDGNVVNVSSIVLGINAQTGSYVKIEADKIDLHGHVSITDLDEYNVNRGSLDVPYIRAQSIDLSGNIIAGPEGQFAPGTTGAIWGQSLYVDQRFEFQNKVVTPQTLTIGGTQYEVLTLVTIS